jgi:hypothetical protein
VPKKLVKFGKPTKVPFFPPSSLLHELKHQCHLKRLTSVLFEDGKRYWHYESVTELTSADLTFWALSNLFPDGKGMANITLSDQFLKLPV